MGKRSVLWLCFLVLTLASVLTVYWAVKDRWLQRLWDKRPTVEVVEPGFYKVLDIADGDTISVDMSGVSERIRLIGVDTPETHDPDTPVQCYGIEAYGFTSSLLEGTSVRLEADPTNSNRDRYDRLLRYVYLKDGTLLNLLLIREGMGFAYTTFPFTKQAQFLKTEENSRSQRKGLWGSCEYQIVDGKYQTSAVSE